jgi:hypothetical protein
VRPHTPASLGSVLRVFLVGVYAAMGDYETLEMERHRGSSRPEAVAAIEEHQARQERVRKHRTRNIAIGVIAVVIIVILLVLVGVFIWLWLSKKPQATSGGSTGQNGSCSSDRDCKSGLTCDQGTNECKTETGGGCSTDSQCQSNHTCYQGTCQGNIFAPCSTNSECVLPLSCFQQSTQPNNVCGSQACTSSSDCRDAGREYCSSGTCLLRPQQPCTSDFQCSVSTGSATCSSGVCKNATGMTCSVGGDCLSGNCTAGTCV